MVRTGWGFSVCLPFALRKIRATCLIGRFHAKAPGLSAPAAGGKPEVLDAGDTEAVRFLTTRLSLPVPGRVVPPDRRPADFREKVHRQIETRQHFGRHRTRLVQDDDAARKGLEPADGGGLPTASESASDICAYYTSGKIIQRNAAGIKDKGAEKQKPLKSGSISMVFISCIPGPGAAAPAPGLGPAPAGGGPAATPHRFPSAG